MNKRVVVALDYPTQAEALTMASRLDPSLCRVKVGKELFTRCGPSVVESLHQRGFDVFLDLKFHDIPNTVAHAILAAAEMGVWMVNVHASGGQAMMERTVELLDQKGVEKPLLIAVTVLTSMQQSDLAGIGLDVPPVEQVKRLALLTQKSGFDGVVCSAQEAPVLRSLVDPSFKLVTPGIRPSGASSDDQKRIVTPKDAIRDGSDYLVVGRPITQAEDPVAALQKIIDEINA
ncbi:orotidine-5'-phosphate decarboxylase [Litoribacillus peritrichatus]|uniref:Orotidine 5'-phosphate decarboxylase n=1 Tax=Litoribacillus peritrichatus TaxID=718191 RepID=A0ABP7M410_9GAMM